MQKIKPKRLLRVAPLMSLVLAGVLLLGMQPILASSFQPKNGGRPNSNSSGGRRAMSLCQIAPTATAAFASPHAATVTVASTTPQTLLVEVPATSARSALIKLEDGQGNYLYHVQFALSSASSITPVTLPTTVPILETGKPYRWSLAIICNHTLDPNDPVFEGWL
ncbi:DUF928 domain-containing protein [Trichothermofontia sp.]